MNTFSHFLISSGALLYGANWKAPTARLLGVSESTLRRWVDGLEPSQWKEQQVKVRFIEAMTWKYEDIVKWLKENDI